MTISQDKLSEWQEEQIQKGLWIDTGKICPSCGGKIYFIKVQNASCCIYQFCENYGDEVE